jgi:hypothetical protein
VTGTAAQLIYTNLEKDQSHGQEGFQVWLRTPDLIAEAEETEIESRLGDFEERKESSTGNAPTVRFQFFRLISGKIVLARSVPLDESDRHNRSGRFYSHALILTADVFQHFNNDPLPIFRQFRFQSSPAEGLAANGDAAARAIPPVSLEGIAQAGETAPISGENLPALVPMLLRACHGDKPVMIGMTADSEQVLIVMQQLFRWLPLSLRPACSFDTLSTGRSLAPTRYAVAGLPVTGFRGRYSNLVMYDPAKQSFAQAALPPADSSFDQWLLKQLQAPSTPPTPARLEAAFQLGICLDAAQVQPDALSGVEDNLFQEMAGSERGIPRLERVLRARLEADVGSGLSGLLFVSAWEWLRRGGLQTFLALAWSIEFELLLRWLFNVYEQRRRDEIQRKVELPALKAFLDKSKNVEEEAHSHWKKLAFIMYRWEGWWSRLSRYICDDTKFPDEAFYWFIPWALHTLPIHVEMSSGQASRGAWCGPRVYCTDRKDDEECQKLLESLLGQTPQTATDSGETVDCYPPARWGWVLQYLLQLIPATEAPVPPRT